MSKILFTHSYFYLLDKKQWRFKQPYPPLMTIQAAAVTREQGFEVSLFDSCLKNDPADIESALQHIKPGYFILVDDGFNYLTKMCLSVMREAAFAMIRFAKANGCTVIVNSSDSTDHYEMYLNQGANYVIHGEVEETLKELLAKLEQGESPENVCEISFEQNGNIETTDPRPVLRNLDSLPLPAWDLIDIESYGAIWKKNHGYFSLNIATTRGCPYKCNWCAKPIYGNRYNSRSPEQVVNEIEFLLKHYKPDHFWMCDDIFGLKPGWVQRFNTLLAERQLSIKYKIQSRVDLLLEPETLEALKQSGAETVWVGAESGSQKILDAMDKGTTVQQIYQATGLMKRKGIQVGHFLQFGYPGENLEDIHATIQMVLTLMPDEIGISVSYPLPGTKFYDAVKLQLKEKQNWVDSDDLALMFKNTYPPRFYKILHRYVHNRYRVQRGVNQIKKSLSLNMKGIRNIISMFINLPLSWVNRFYLYRLGRT